MSSPPAAYYEHLTADEEHHHYNDHQFLGSAASSQTTILPFMPFPFSNHNYFLPPGWRLIDDDTYHYHPNRIIYPTTRITTNPHIDNTTTRSHTRSHTNNFSTRENIINATTPLHSTASTAPPTATGRISNVTPPSIMEEHLRRVHQVNHNIDVANHNHALFDRLLLDQYHLTGNNYIRTSLEPLAAASLLERVEEGSNNGNTENNTMKSSSIERSTTPTTVHGLQAALHYLRDVFASKPKLRSKFLSILKKYKNQKPANNDRNHDDMENNIYNMDTTKEMLYKILMLFHNYNVNTENAGNTETKQTITIAKYPRSSGSAISSSGGNKKPDLQQAIHFVSNVKKHFAEADKKQAAASGTGPGSGNCGSGPTAAENTSYNEFIQILNQYQKNEISIKDMLGPISTLFCNHPYSLLNDFIHFIPDQLQYQAKEIFDRVIALGICSVCYEQPKCNVFVPCGHVGVCHKCSYQIMSAAQSKPSHNQLQNESYINTIPKCPICNQNATDSVRILLHPCIDDTMYYIKQIKRICKDNAPDAYKQFFDICNKMFAPAPPPPVDESNDKEKEDKDDETDEEEEQVDIATIAQRLLQLIHGHSNLLLGFNLFLPKKYHISVRYHPDPNVNQGVAESSDGGGDHGKDSRGKKDRKIKRAAASAGTMEKMEGDDRNTTKSSPGIEKGESVATTAFNHHQPQHHHKKRQHTCISSSTPVVHHDKRRKKQTSITNGSESQFYYSSSDPNVATELDSTTTTTHQRQHQQHPRFWQEEENRRTSTRIQAKTIFTNYQTNQIDRIEMMNQIAILFCNEPDLFQGFITDYLAPKSAINATDGEDTSTSASTASHEAQTNTAATFNNMKEQAMETYKKVTSFGICTVCRKRPRSHTCIPCGHLCICEVCAVDLEQQPETFASSSSPTSIQQHNHKQVPKCPTCHVEISKTVRIFLS